MYNYSAMILYQYFPTELNQKISVKLEELSSFECFDQLYVFRHDLFVIFFLNNGDLPKVSNNSYNFLCFTFKFYVYLYFTIILLLRSQLDVTSAAMSALPQLKYART